MATQEKRRPNIKPATVAAKSPQDFESVAERLQCDQDLEKFDAKLKRIAKAKPKQVAR